MGRDLERDSQRVGSGMLYIRRSFAYILKYAPSMSTRMCVTLPANVDAIASGTCATRCGQRGDSGARAR